MASQQELDEQLNVYFTSLVKHTVLTAQQLLPPKLADAAEVRFWSGNLGIANAKLVEDLAFMQEHDVGLYVSTTHGHIRRDSAGWFQYPSDAFAFNVPVLAPDFELTQQRFNEALPYIIGTLAMGKAVVVHDVNGTIEAPLFTYWLACALHTRLNAMEPPSLGERRQVMNLIQQAWGATSHVLTKAEQPKGAVDKAIWKRREEIDSKLDKIEMPSRFESVVADWTTIDRRRDMFPKWQKVDCISDHNLAMSTREAAFDTLVASCLGHKAGLPVAAFEEFESKWASWKAKGGKDSHSRDNKGKGKSKRSKGKGDKGGKGSRSWDRKAKVGDSKGVKHGKGKDKETSRHAKGKGKVKHHTKGGTELAQPRVRPANWWDDKQSSDTHELRLAFLLDFCGVPEQDIEDGVWTSWRKDGWNVLHIALNELNHRRVPEWWVRAMRLEEFVDLYDQRHGDIDARVEDPIVAAGATPLQLLCSSFLPKKAEHEADILRMAMRLLSLGADPNSCLLRSGRSCLTQAISNGREDLALALVQHGADPDKRDAHGQTPLEIASRDRAHEAAMQRVLSRHQAAKTRQTRARLVL